MEWGSGGCAASGDASGGRAPAGGLEARLPEAEIFTRQKRSCGRVNSKCKNLSHNMQAYQPPPLATANVHVASR